jgi:hypothetical protein
MSSVIISGDTSGTVTLAAPAVAGSNTITLQAATATMSVNTLATAVASTSGTSIDFTSLPSWIKKITITFAGVSTNGSSNIQFQIGSGSFTTSGYLGAASSPTTTNMSTGFLTSNGGSAADIRHGIATIALVTTNTYAMSYLGGYSNGAVLGIAAGSIAIGGTLDCVRITTVNGTDTFDAGTVNILYEG